MNAEDQERLYLAWRHAEQMRDFLAWRRENPAQSKRSTTLGRVIQSEQEAHKTLRDTIMALPFTPDQQKELLAHMRRDWDQVGPMVERMCGSQEQEQEQGLRR